MGGGSPPFEVFLSYAREDRRFAEKLAYEIEAAGVQV